MPARRVGAAAMRMERRMRMRGGARRQHRAAYAPQTPLQTRRGDQRSPAGAETSPPVTTTEGPSVERGRFPGTSETAGTGHADGAAARGEGNLAIAEPPRRKTQRAPYAETSSAGNRTHLHDTHYTHDTHTTHKTGIIQRSCGAHPEMV